MTEHSVTPESTPEKQNLEGLTPEQAADENHVVEETGHHEVANENETAESVADDSAEIDSVSEDVSQEPDGTREEQVAQGEEKEASGGSDDEPSEDDDEQVSDEGEAAEASEGDDEAEDDDEQDASDEASDEEEAAEESDEDGEVAEDDEEAVDDNKQWYVVKVQSGREESIKNAIERRIKIEGMEEQFGEIVIPVERVTEMRRGKRYVKEKKLFPGYLMVNLEYNDRMLYLFRETAGVGDFVGASLNHPPQPMRDDEVEFMKARQKSLEPTTEAQPQKSMYSVSDRVKVKDGTFAGMEGEVKEVMEVKGAVKVELTIFGRPVPVELEYWQVEFA